MPDTSIQYITGDKIDRKKWDECIRRSPNGLIYAYSFYLDIMAQTWDGLVLNDYEAVMPLPCRKKWGVDYIFQPFLTPVLGVFSGTISEELISGFLENIPSRFQLWDISFNHSNSIHDKFQRQFIRSNYVLPLSSSYEKIKTGYSENIIRNIAKALKAGCELRKNIPLPDIISICQIEWPKFTKIENNSFENIDKNFSLFQPHAISYGVYSSDNILLCACVFLKDEKRAYYWLVGNDPLVKETGASPMLIDGFIRDHAGQDMVLDFEGSDKKSIAEFYQRFGGTPEPFTTLYKNELPFPINLLKKTPAHYRRLIS